MKHKNGSGSSEHLDSEFDVTYSVKDDDKMVGRASSSSFSSSSSSSSSNPMEVNGGENDVKFPEFEENESISLRSNNTESAKTSSSGRLTVKLSSMASPRFSDFDTSNASPIQSPPIQVMAQSDDYDPNRIPSSIFSPKQSDDSEWSAASNESLFSIHMGSNSFSMDSDFFISQSGKLHWLDDGFEYSCFTPHGSLTSPMVETTVEDERKSADEKEELLETLNASPTDFVRGKESSPDWESSPNSRVPTEGTRNSDSSSQSTGSFAFPLLAGGSPVKEDAGKPQSPSSTPPTPKGAAEAETTPPPAAPATTPKAGGNQWFNCFSCFPICC
ncbi:hypothetical protein Lser_V15G07612 [Lactuca serriola]